MLTLHYSPCGGDSHSSHGVIPTDLTLATLKPELSTETTAVMINYEEIVTLVIFVPCVICVLVGIFCMASHRCGCCPSVVSHLRRRDRPCPNHQEVPMRVLRLSQHSYHRLTQSGSRPDQNSADVRLRVSDGCMQLSTCLLSTLVTSLEYFCTIYFS